MDREEAAQRRAKADAERLKVYAQVIFADFCKVAAGESLKEECRFNEHAFPATIYRTGERPVVIIGGIKDERLIGWVQQVLTAHGYPSPQILKEGGDRIFLRVEL